MAWRRSGDKPLSEPMMVGLPTHEFVTRPQWVKRIFQLLNPIYMYATYSGWCLMPLRRSPSTVIKNSAFHLGMDIETVCETQRNWYNSLEHSTWILRLEVRHFLSAKHQFVENECCCLCIIDIKFSNANLQQKYVVIQRCYTPVHDSIYWQLCLKWEIMIPKMIHDATPALLDILMSDMVISYQEQLNFHNINTHWPHWGRMSSQ